MTEENSLRTGQAFVFCGAAGQNERGVNESIPRLVCLCFHLPPSTYSWPAVPWDCWGPGKTPPLMHEHVFGLMGSLHSAIAREMTGVHRIPLRPWGRAGKCLIVGLHAFGKHQDLWVLLSLCVCNRDKHMFSNRQTDTVQTWSQLLRLLKKAKYKGICTANVKLSAISKVELIVPAQKILVDCVHF